jgi:D-beta-D-heptose 7-phosphate kinase/D-beta-D-heptose 1-phosphate adenosyltransferase
MDVFGTQIVTLDDFARKRPKLPGTLVVTSGGFDPIHPGHISCILDSRKHGDVLAVIVNGDNFLRAKKGKPFQNLETRCMIVSAIRGVDFVIPFEIENDTTVCKALAAIKPDVFTKGGDRKDIETIPEWDVCRENNIKIVTGVGMEKKWSSSWFLDEWGQFIASKNGDNSF